MLILWEENLQLIDFVAKLHFHEFCVVFFCKTPCKLGYIKHFSQLLKLLISELKSIKIGKSGENLLHKTKEEKLLLLVHSESYPMYSAQIYLKYYEKLL